MKELKLEVFEKEGFESVVPSSMKDCKRFDSLVDSEIGKDREVIMPQVQEKLLTLYGVDLKKMKLETMLLISKEKNKAYNFVFKIEDKLNYLHFSMKNGKLNLEKSEVDLKKKTFGFF